MRFFSDIVCVCMYIHKKLRNHRDHTRLTRAHYEEGKSQTMRIYRS